MPPAFSTLGWWSKSEEPHLTPVNIFGSNEGHTPSLIFKNPFENHFMLIKSIDRTRYPFLFCRAETSVLTRLTHSFSESPRQISASFLLSQTCHFSCFFQGGQRAEPRQRALAYSFHSMIGNGRAGLKSCPKRLMAMQHPIPDRWVLERRNSHRKERKPWPYGFSTLAIIRITRGTL